MLKHFKMLKLYLFLIIVVAVITGCSGDQQVAQIQISDYPEYETDVAKLYVAKCSGCHAAPLPKMHEAKQWSGIVQRMQMRMANKAITPLNKQEVTIVVGYLEKHAKK